MSVEIKARIICDQCGSWITGRIEKRSTHMYSSYADAKDFAMAHGWLINQRYGTARHVCGACADGRQPSEPQGCDLNDMQDHPTISELRDYLWSKKGPTKISYIDGEDDSGEE